MRPRSPAFAARGLDRKATGADHHGDIQRRSRSLATLVHHGSGAGELAGFELGSDRKDTGGRCRRQVRSPGRCGRRSRRSLGEFSTLHQARAAYERDYILKKLDENHGNVSRTADAL